MLTVIGDPQYILRISYGSEPSMKTLKLYVFQCGEMDRYAISNDSEGWNLPKDRHPWLLRSETNATELEEDNLTGALDVIAVQGYCFVQARADESGPIARTLQERNSKH